MSEKILLVDDEQGIRRVLGISLADMGYNVLTAENAEQAQKIFEREHPPIVLTDIKMPGMDGIGLLRRLKSRNPDTEVIIITGHGDMDLAIRSLKNEATDFITKPIDDEDLEKALEKAKERRMLRGQLKNYTETLEELLKEKSNQLATFSETGQPENQGQDRYARLFKELPGYVTVYEPDFSLTGANQAFQDDFGYRPEDPTFCYEIFKGADEPCLNCPVEKTFDDGQSHQQEMTYKFHNGTSRKVLAWTTPVKNAEGRIARVMMMATDISKIVDLKDHLASLGLMIGSVSHGIKGLLTGLDGAVYLLDSGVAKDNKEQIDDGLKIVKEMAGRIKNLMLDILYYAKERELKRSDVNVRDFAEETAAIVEPKTRGTGVKMLREFSDELKSVHLSVDAPQLQAALVNILENAVDACSEDASKPAHTITFRLKENQDVVIFEIQDDGVGMNAETREKIFTLFFSSKSTRGTGIGLFVSKKIANQHGGDIEVLSEPGKGACFRVSIPKEAS